MTIGRLSVSSERLEHGGLVEHVYVHDRKGWHWAWRLTKFGLLVFLVLLVIAAAIIWIWRKPIADDYIRDELAAARRPARPTRSTGSASEPSRSAISSSAIRPTPT